jgi:hypothetical protein
MDRRSVFKNLVIIAGGILILPSCSQDKSKASIQLNKLDIDAETEKLLAEIAETIIPETDTPGAKTLNIHLFVLKMLDDCYEKEDQQKFISGLRELEADVRKQFGNSFTECSPEQRRQALTNIENKKNASADSVFFYEIMKDRTMQGYMNSKYVMTNLVIYELIPSIPYNGYAPA